MKKILLPIFVIYFHFFANGQVILYENHFEAPNVPPQANCAPDFDQTSVNTLFGGTGTGTGGGGTFSQQFTVETILINGSSNQYTDPSHKGENYSIGMFSTAQNDKLALTLNSQGYPYINVTFDLSAIGVNGCGVPKNLATPQMNVKLYNSPSGTFSFNNPGALLDQKNDTGIVPGATIYTFNWAPLGFSLNNSGSGFITVVFDLLAGTYASFDNLKITADSFSLPLKLLSFAGENLKNKIILKWQAVNEIDFSHYEVEKSSNGISFFRFSEVKSKISGIKNDYEIIDNRLFDNQNYYRLKMVDRDGKFTYSKVISIIVANSSIAKIYPNPINSTATIRLQSLHRENVDVKVINGEGKVVSIKKSILTVGNNLIPLNTTSLTSGFYAVVIAGQNINEHLTFSKQ